MNIEERALELRKRIFKTACFAGGGHIAPALSMADLISVLYFDNVLRYDAKNPDWRKRDIFVLSKGHACLALYAALSMAGFFDAEKLRGFCQMGSQLGGHPKMHDIPGVEASTGALGHGMLFASGIALANKIDGLDSQVYTIVGDGECEEGSMWEGFMAAAYHELDNLVVIIDHNKFQAMDSLESIMGLHDFGSKLKAFGFSVADIDGHDYAAIKQAVTEREIGKPRVVIANTIKGKGISFMEGKPIWHFRMPNKEEMKIALHDLQMTEEELDRI